MVVVACLVVWFHVRRPGVAVLAKKVLIPISVVPSLPRVVSRCRREWAVLYVATGAAMVPADTVGELTVDCIHCSYVRFILAACHPVTASVRQAAQRRASVPR